MASAGMPSWLRIVPAVREMAMRLWVRAHAGAGKSMAAKPQCAALLAAMCCRLIPALYRPPLKMSLQPFWTIREHVRLLGASSRNPTMKILTGWKSHPVSFFGVFNPRYDGFLTFMRFEPSMLSSLDTPLPFCLMKFRLFQFSAAL